MPIHEKAAQADSCTAEFIRTCHCQGRRHVRKARKKDGGHGVLESPNNLSVKEKQVFSNSGHPPQHERFTYFSPLPEATPQGFFDIWGVRHDWKVQRTSWDVESTLDGSFSCMNGPLPWWNQRAPLSFIKGSAWCFSPWKITVRPSKVHVFVDDFLFPSIFQVPSLWCERLEERHALVFFLTTHGVGWGGAVFTFLQLAHAGDAHAMNATLLMGWCGVGLCSGSFNLHTLVMHTPWMLRYSWGGVGGAVFTFLQLAHAGDAHAMNATLLMACVGWGCVHVPSTCTRWWCTRHECYATHGVGLCSRSFNLHTLVMHTPWMLRYSWGGVGWGCVHVPSTCTRWWCTRHECYATHGVVWGEAVFRFLQLAHAGDAHAMNATLLMGWCGVRLWSGSFNLHTLVMHTPWMLRYSWGGVGGAVFTFLQLAHAGDAHAMNATLLMGWCGVGLCSGSFNLHTLVMHTPWMLRYSWGGVGWLCSCSFNLHTRGMGLGLGLGWGGWCC